MELTFFASYPRCGVHWMIAMYMVVTGRKRWTKLGKPYLLEGVPAILKSHRLPQNLSVEKRGKVVYTYRHGKDAVLAYSKFWHSRQYHRGSTTEPYSTEWLKKCVIHQRFAKRWQTHIESFFALKDEPRCKIHFVRFEDMLVDPVKELKKVMQFVGIGDPKQATFTAVRHLVAKAPNEDEILLGAEKEMPTKGFVIGAEHLVQGESTPEERIKGFTRRWEGFKYWTKDVNDMVDDQIGDTLVKYGYEK